MVINKIHHIAIICSDYEKSKWFYTEILGLEVIAEVFRNSRDSWKCDLALKGEYIIELFSFPNPPKRVSRPEACGLRHMAFEVKNVEEFQIFLTEKSISSEPIRIDEFTGKKFTFFSDPDGLPLEVYEK